MNTKSEYKPLYIYEPGTEIIPYGGGVGETRPWFSKFPIWNHWPVAQIPSDGRDALALDHVSSSAITSPEPPMTRRAKDGAVEGRFLMGLTNQPIGKALPVARAWLNSPAITLSTRTYASSGYSRDDRAYRLHRLSAGNVKLEFSIRASETSPAVNPAFVIDGWGDENVSFRLNGKPLAEGEDFRVGHLDRLDGTSLIVWIRAQLTGPTNFSLTRQPRRD